MRFAGFRGKAAVLVLTLAAVSAHAGPQIPGLAARLSAALGGPLDTELGEAAAMDCQGPCPAVTLRCSAADDYRRRVALERQRAEPWTADAFTRPSPRALR
jgi:hypothetical protein